MVPQQFTVNQGGRGAIASEWVRTGGGGTPLAVESGYSE